MCVTYIHEESGQDLAASVYHRYRNINFNSQKLVGTYFCEMRFVDTSNCASRGENMLKWTENLKTTLSSAAS